MSIESKRVINREDQQKERAFKEVADVRITDRERSAGVTQAAWTTDWNIMLVQSLPQTD